MIFFPNGSTLNDWGTERNIFFFVCGEGPQANAGGISRLASQKCTMSMAHYYHIHSYITISADINYKTYILRYIIMV